MKIRILGCGAAGGVPMISRGWGKCDSNNPKNRRLRTSLLLRHDQLNLLFDTGPDLREQLLSAQIKNLAAVLYTHEHADHTHGIDDLREVNRVMQKGIPVYANATTLNLLKERFSYAFRPVNVEKEPFFHPWLEPNLIKPGEPFYIKDLKIIPFTQDHEWTTSLGFRINNFGYSTDVVHLYESALSVLKGVDTWVVGCLSEQDHPSHASVRRVLEWVDILKPRRTILTHMSVNLDYASLCASLPKGVEPGYDGMEFDVN